MNKITFASTDVGLIIRATITFVDFDPTGAACHLSYTNLGGQIQTRPMVFDGVSIATYTIQAGDFDTGYYTAAVQAVKGAVIVNSDRFQIAVL